MSLKVTLHSDLGEIARTMGAKAQVIVDKTAADVEAGAKMRAPVDTGYLKSSINAHPVEPVHAEVTVGAEYGRYVELGTRHMAAQPYFTPAIEVARPGFEAAARRIVE